MEVKMQTLFQIWNARNPSGPLPKVQASSWMRNAHDFFVPQALTPNGDFVGYTDSGGGYAVPKASAMSAEWRVVELPVPQKRKGWRHKTLSNLHGGMIAVFTDEEFAALDETVAERYERYPSVDEK